MAPVENKAFLEAVLRVIEHHWDQERDDFTEQAEEGQRDHIFNDMARVRLVARMRLNNLTEGEGHEVGTDQFS